MRAALRWMVLLWTAATARAGTLYVAPGGGHVAPFDAWSNAAHDLQSAIDAAAAGDTILVSNGLYNIGGRPAAGAALTNRVTIDKPVAVRSVNGPFVTAIAGRYDPVATNGPAAVRGVWLTTNASLTGFLVVSGATAAAGATEMDGGGLYCVAPEAWVTNCMIRDSRAYRLGGGVRGGSLRGCVLAGNRGLLAGGATIAALAGCSIVDNEAVSDSSAAVGGVFGGSMTNCLAWGNRAVWPSNSNHRAAPVSFTCTWPLPASGTGNFTNDPRLVAGAWPYLRADSPCIDAGTTQGWSAAATDLQGDPRVLGAGIDLGADEFAGAAATGAIALAISAEQAAAGPNYPFQFTADIAGQVLGVRWDLGDGSQESDTAAFRHLFPTAGVYTVVCIATNFDTAAAASVTVTVADAVQCVATSGDDGNSGLSWAAPKATLQAAVDASLPGGTVWVSNGLYAAGGRAVAGGPTNRVVIDRMVVVRSVNGPLVTQIAGAPGTGVTDDFSAVRCAYVASRSRLVGFTLTNGCTWWSGDARTAQSAGGAWCESEDARLEQCIIAGCRARWHGGATLRGELRSCVLVGNRAEEAGGGAVSGRLVNCTVAGNSAYAAAGGLLGVTGVNCIVYHNLAPAGANHQQCALSYSCSTPLPAGPGNLAADPGLLALLEPRLRAGSACVDGGSAEPWMAAGADWRGDPRLAGPVDIGADEFGSATGGLQVAAHAIGSFHAALQPVTLWAGVAGRAAGTIWDLGDGAQTADVFQLTHIYATSGLYTVSLLASNADGVVTSRLELTVLDPVADLTWNGPAPAANWRVGLESNWVAVSGGPGPVVFTNGARVLFSDPPAGVATNVNVSSVQPGSVVVWSDHPAHYRFFGGAPGGNTLTKRGGSHLTLESGAAHTGETLLAEGEVRLVCPGGQITTLGAGDAPTYIQPGAALDFPRNGYQGATLYGLQEHLFIAGAGPGGGGAVVNNYGEDNVHMFALLRDSTLELMADAAIGGTSRWDLYYNPIQLNGHALTKTGPNVIYHWNKLVGPGELVVTQGTFGFARSSLGAESISGATIRVEAGGRLWLWDNQATHPLIVVNGGWVGLQEVGAGYDCYQRGPFIISNTATFAGYDAFALHLYGCVSGPGALRKMGGGEVRLLGTNTYAGGTAVREGRLHGTTFGLAGCITNDATLAFVQSFTGAFSGVISSTGAVTFAGGGRVVVPDAQPYSGPTLISEGALQVDGALAGGGAVTVLPAATLCGTGSIAGPVACAGTIAPGAPVGTLHLGSSLELSTSATLRIEVGAAGCDLLAVAGTASLSGRLQADSLGGHDAVAGTTFVLLRAAAVTGTFSSITGTPHPGTGWVVQYAPTSVTMVVTGTPVYGFDAFVYAIPNPALRGYLDDPEGDGYPNLLEYATMGDAAAADDMARLRGAWSADTRPAIRFLPRPGATDISYYIERAWAPGAAGWESVLSNLSGGGWSGPAAFQLVPGTNGNELWAGDAGGATGAVFRLRITRP